MAMPAVSARRPRLRSPPNVERRWSRYVDGQPPSSQCRPSTTRLFRRCDRPPPPPPNDAAGCSGRRTQARASSPHGGHRLPLRDRRQALHRRPGCNDRQLVHSRRGPAAAHRDRRPLRPQWYGRPPGLQRLGVRPRLPRCVAPFQEWHATFEAVTTTWATGGGKPLPRSRLRRLELADRPFFDNSHPFRTVPPHR